MKNYKKQTAGMLLCLIAAALLGGCGGEEAKPGTETAAPAETNAVQEAAADPAASESAEAEKPGTEETYPQTVAAPAEERELFGIMYATVIDVRREADGSSVYMLQDNHDPENAWTLSDADIGAMETELEKGGMAAFLFEGDMIGDFENVSFIAAVPYGSYRIGSMTGTTTNNMMSSFSVQEDNGMELIFTKDSCRIEEDAMSENSGDRVTVYYAVCDADMIYYPLRVYSAD